MPTPVTLLCRRCHTGLLFFRDGETSKLTGGNDGGALGGDVEAMGSPAGRERARSVGNSTDHARARPATRSHSMSERISLAGRQRRLSAHVSLLAMKSAVHKALAHSDSTKDSYHAHVSYGAGTTFTKRGCPSVVPPLLMTVCYGGVQWMMPTEWALRVLLRRNLRTS